MKKLYLLLLITGAALAMTSSCNMIDDVTLDPDETVAKEGNYWTSQSADYPAANITVTENKKGFAIMTIDYEGQEYVVTGKISKTKIQDFVYSGGDEDKPFTLVDFDAEVGDKWEYKVGTYTVTREITSKSTDDDYMVWALGVMIKVTQVEETIPDGITVMGYPAEVKKILWTFNHKFGWIGAEVTKKDNSIVNFGLNDTNAGM